MPKARDISHLPPEEQQKILCKREVEKTRYYAKRKELLEGKARYYLDNKATVSARKKLAYNNNRAEVIKKNNEYAVARAKVDPNYRLARNLRSRVNSGLFRKSGSKVRDLGCTLPELRAYLEQQFTEGMTWENWSRHGWHIDHIQPLASFDLSDRASFLRAMHYTNPRPLWAKDNLTKSASLMHPKEQFLLQLNFEDYSEGEQP